jgi:ABC-type branched-subunit amino acid transport system substrate-binding protein
MNKLISILFACLPLLSANPASAQDGVTKSRILIGQNITLQGGKNDYGMAVMAGMETYLSGINARGGINGRQIVLKTLDDDNKSDKAEANARQLIEKDKVFILYGSIEGGPSNAVMKAANDLKVPFFGPLAGAPTLRRPHQPLVFPVRAEHREEFRVMLAQAKSLGISKVAFLRSDSEAGSQHLANVKLICDELGMKLVLDMPFKSDIKEAQLDAFAQQMDKLGVQMVVNHGGIGVYETLIRKVRTRSTHTAVYAVNSGSAQLAKHLGPLAEGIVFSQVVPSPWEKKTAITREYQEEFTRAKPGQEFSYGSLEGYMTAKALVMALRLAGSHLTRESFVAALNNTTLDINGLKANYATNNHQGLAFVDLSIVNHDGKFRH